MMNTNYTQVHSSVLLNSCRSGTSEYRQTYNFSDLDILGLQRSRIPTKSEMQHSLDQSLVKLQSVLNSAARLIFMWHKSIMWRQFYASYIGCVFPNRIDIKLAVLIFKCLNGLAPSYLACKFHRVADAESRQRILSSNESVVQPTLVALFQSLPHMYGTLFHQAWRHRWVWPFSSLAWK